MDDARFSSSADSALSEADLARALALVERLAGGYETTPARLSPFVESCCRALGEAEPQWVPVITLPRAEPGRSAKNVAAKIARSGGAACHGWAVWENPGLSVSATFHSVWRSPRGELFDVTPAPHEAPRILFVADGRLSPGFDAARASPSRVKWADPDLRGRLGAPGALEQALRGFLAEPEPPAARR